MTVALAVLIFVTVQRLGELALAQRNTARLMQQGAIEVGASHYPLVVAVHAAWLAGLWWFGWNRSIDPAWLTIFAALQIARLWVIATLGPRWTTRIIILPGAPLVSGGPFKFVSHPNYLIVVAEICVLPLAFGLVMFAALFSVLNALVLTLRIRAENAALAR